MTGGDVFSSKSCLNSSEKSLIELPLPFFPFFFPLSLGVYFMKSPLRLETLSLFAYLEEVPF